MRRDLAMCALLLALVAASIDAQGRDKNVVGARQMSSAGRTNLALGLSYLRSGDLKTALDYANKANRTDSGASEVHTMLGMIYARVNDQSKAMQEYQRAVSLSPTDGNTLNAFGAYACEQKQYDLADQQFTKALADPFYQQSEQALFNAGKCAQNAGLLPKAESYLRRALEKHPDHLDALYSLAEVELAQGQPMDARAFIQRRDSLGADRRTLALAARIEDAAGDAKAAAVYRQRERDLTTNNQSTPDAGGINQP
jgi:type IV pilus assembly protein PilF